MTDATAITDGLTAEQRAQLEALFQPKAYRGDDFLLVEGQPTPGLLLIDSGRVGVSKKDMGKHEQLITELDGPAVIGELELLTGDACAATVRARSSVSARLLPRPAFEAMLDRGDGGAIRLLRNLARALGQKLEATNETYVDLAIWR